MLNYSKFPNRALVEGLQRYFEQGILPGSFLCAVLENDLEKAVLRADSHNGFFLRDIVKWLINEAPPDSWGSQGRVKWHAVHIRDTIKAATHDE